MTLGLTRPAEGSVGWASTLNTDLGLIDAAFPVNATAFTAGSVNSYNTGLGAVTQLVGPTDQALALAAGSPNSATSTGNNLNLTAGSGGATSGAGGALAVKGGPALAGAGGLASLIGGTGVGTNQPSGGAVIDMGNSSGNATETITFKGPPTGTSGAGTNVSVTLVQITNKGSTVTNATGSAIAQSATDGFLYVPVCGTGAPTGVPTAFTGATALVVGGDNNLYARLGSAWAKVNAGASAYSNATSSNSASITNTTTVIAGGSSGTIIPANVLRAGSAFRFVVIGGVASTTTTGQTFTIYFGANGTTADTQIASFNQGSSSSLGVAQNCRITIEMAVATAGASGVIAGSYFINNTNTSGIASSMSVLGGLTIVASALNTTNAGFFTLAYNSGVATTSLVTRPPTTFEVVRF